MSPWVQLKQCFWWPLCPVTLELCVGRFCLCPYHSDHYWLFFHRIFTFCHCPSSQCFMSFRSTAFLKTSFLTLQKKKRLAKLTHRIVPITLVISGNHRETRAEPSPPTWVHNNHPTDTVLQLLDVCCCVTGFKYMMDLEVYG